MSQVNTPLVPKVARRFPRLDSTSARLLADLEASADLPAGTVYVATDQTAGRGQGSNRWHATPGDNLTLSLLLRPVDLAVDRLFRLSQFAALAVRDTVVAHLPDGMAADRVHVKWPNDVYVDGRKIGGILVQNGLRGHRVGWSVIGIGLNVNEAAFPAGLAAPAVSLAGLRGAPLHLPTVEEDLLAALATGYSLLPAATPDALDTDYHRSLFRRGCWADYRRTATGEVFRARLRGVSPAGRLLLELPDGSVEAFDLRSVRFC